ncbi:MAG: tRNA 4-thiouridine(8) synthase ThiI [Firmicutes bacterium]|nr:tRNA 4-thiouridine(8) synthase ThiI [Bacillota bacterium]
MENVIILRYGELHLKGNNRGWFEKKLIDDIKAKLKGISHSFKHQRGRYLISDFEQCDCDVIVDKCRRCFGLNSLSIAYKCKADLEQIAQACLLLVEERGIKNGVYGGGIGGNYETFKVVSNRADKNFEYNSMQLNSIIGGRILEANEGIKVDIHKPSFEVNIDVREEGHALIFSSFVACAGGMPNGSAGKGLLLLSGGLDSPVAGHMMLRRGLALDVLHFHSYPYTNERARQKVVELAEKLAEYCGKINLRLIKLTQIQEKIKRYCDERYAVIMLRMVMMRIAGSLAKRYGCGCVVSGESLGQVASQTLESLTIIDAASGMPVFRPLIGLDKQEIIDMAKMLGTFDISILPFEDCCTIFLPKHPVTRPTHLTAAKEIGKIPDLDELILAAIGEVETVVIG